MASRGVLNENRKGFSAVSAMRFQQNFEGKLISRPRNSRNFEEMWQSSFPSTKRVSSSKSICFYLCQLKHSPALHHSIFIGRGGGAVASPPPAIDVRRYGFHQTASSRRCLIYESIEEACREISCSPFSSWEKERARQNKVRKTATKGFPFLLLPFPYANFTFVSFLVRREKFFLFFWHFAFKYIFVVSKKFFLSHSRAFPATHAARFGIESLEAQEGIREQTKFPIHDIKARWRSFSPVSDFFAALVVRRLWVCWCHRILVTWLIRYILHQKYEISLVSAFSRLLFMEFSKVNGDELFNCKSYEIYGHRRRKKALFSEESAGSKKCTFTTLPHPYLIWRMRYKWQRHKKSSIHPLATHLSRLSIIARAFYRCSPTHRSLKSYQNSSQDVQIPSPPNPKATSRPIPADPSPPLDIVRKMKSTAKKLSRSEKSLQSASL